MLICCYVGRNDTESALDQVDQCIKRFKKFPAKRELTVKLIEAEDAEGLQRVMDFSSRVQSEMNGLYDLVFAFLQCGRVRQAKKVLEVYFSIWLDSNPLNIITNI